MCFLSDLAAHYFDQQSSECDSSTENCYSISASRERDYESRVRDPKNKFHSAEIAHQCAAGFEPTRAFHTVSESAIPTTATGSIAIGHAYQLSTTFAAAEPFSGSSPP